MSEGKGTTVTARFVLDGITICVPNRVNEGTEKLIRGLSTRLFELLAAAI